MNLVNFTQALTLVSPSENNRKKYYNHLTPLGFVKYVCMLLACSNLLHLLLQLFQRFINLCIDPTEVDNMLFFVHGTIVKPNDVSPLLFSLRERSLIHRRRLFPFRMADQSKSTVP